MLEKIKAAADLDSLTVLGNTWLESQGLPLISWGEIWNYALDDEGDTTLTEEQVEILFALNERWEELEPVFKSWED